MAKIAVNFSPRPAPKARQTNVFYESQSYSAFPHVVRMEGDELMIAFRQAPKINGLRHTHPRSIITVIRSYDLGESWEINSATQMAAGGGQELGLIYLGKGKVGGALAAHEVVLGHEAKRARFRHAYYSEYPWIGGQPDTSKPTHAYHNVGGLWCWSDNFGLSWRVENAVLFGDNMQACAPPVQLLDGTLVIPAYGVIGRSTAWSSMLYRSSDGGATWSEMIVIARGRPQTRDYEEPALMELDPGHLLCLHRVGNDPIGPPRIFWQNESFDNGQNWCKPQPTLIQSGACPRLLKLHDGRLLLTYGRRLEPFGIYAAISEDQGTSWGNESWRVRRTPNGDQGYTSSIELEPGRIFTTSYAQNGRGVTGITGTFWDLP